MDTLAILRQHPFPVRAHFERSLVVTLSAPAVDLAPLLPPPLELDTHGSEGFSAVALVKTRHLRSAALLTKALAGEGIRNYRLHPIYGLTGVAEPVH
jgi:hypothetical protein